MTLDEARSHVAKLTEAFNARDMDTLLSLYSDHYVARWGGKGEMRGKEALKKFLTARWAAFSDVRFSGEVLAAAADSYTCRYSNSGTHDGVFQGKAPTGKHFEAWGLYLARTKDGKMVESWTAFDDLGQRVQLGLLPDLR